MQAARTAAMSTADKCASTCCTTETCWSWVIFATACKAGRRFQTRRFEQPSFRCSSRARRDRWNLEIELNAEFDRVVWRVRVQSFEHAETNRQARRFVFIAPGAVAARDSQRARVVDDRAKSMLIEVAESLGRH